LAKKPELDRTVVAQNRKARHNYFIEETFEAGLALTGTEVKSLRGGRSTIAESYVTEEGGEAWLVNANIPIYASGNRFNHEPRRPRKLLLHRAQINKLIGAIQREGRTVVPLQVYFNPRGRAKVEIALATGKREYDKRNALRERQDRREADRAMSNRESR
jgi:SsrA-binding protein